MATAAFCPKCGESNTGKTSFCLSCGERLVIEEESSAETQRPAAAMAASARPAVATYQQPATAYRKPSTASPISRDYSALRGVAALCKVLSWLFVALAIIQVIIGVIILLDSFLTGLGVIVSAVVAGVIGYVFWRIIAESISVILDIEENTRVTANLLQQGNR